jgi:hypothetical protein
LEWFELTIGVIGGAVAQTALSPGLQRGIDKVGLVRRRNRVRRSQVNGIWRARYLYISSEAADEARIDEYLFVLRRRFSHVSGLSLPMENGSTVVLELQFEGATLSGIWREQTSDSNISYHGVCQLLIRSTGDLMRGRWIGFTRTESVGEGPWEFIRLDTKTHWLVRRRYRDVNLKWHVPADQSVVDELGRPAVSARD